MSKKKDPTFRIEIPPHTAVKLEREVTGDSGLIHDKYDKVNRKEAVERVTTHNTPFIEEGVSEERAKLFRQDKRVKVTEEKPPEKPKAKAEPKAEKPKK